MLAEEELEEYFGRHGLNETAREYIRATRSSPPFRRVGDFARSNVCVQFASRKMGRTIQAESRTAEYAFALEFEYSPEVLEFWDQPAPVPVTRTLKSGGVRTSGYTPDFLLLALEGPCIVEVKDAETLQQLVEAKSADWQVEGDAVTYQPAQKAFGALGLMYRVCSSGVLSAIRSSNLRLLLRARSAVPEISDGLVERVRCAFRGVPTTTLASLGASLGISDLSPIIRLIEAGYLASRLSQDLLSRPSTCWLATEAQHLDLVVSERGFEPGANSDAPQLPSSKSMARYVRRVERLKEGRQGRSERRWRRELGVRSLKDPVAFEKLMPHFDRCGNRRQRVNPKCEEFLLVFIRTRVAASTRMTMRGAFRLYKAEAEDAHPEFPGVSYATFRKRLLAEDPEAVASGRGGRRAANAAALPSDVEDRALKATRPFELASLDHYNANISLLIGEANGKRYTARPWLSGLVDVASGVILALWASFKPPSAISCAIVIRRCVRLHGRLPEAIVVDRGADFRSLFFMSVLASRGIDLVLRPAAHARFGAEIERLFGLAQTNFLAFLPGNFANGIEARSVSSSHAPAATAELSIEDFWDACLRYLDWHNATATALGQPSPIDRQLQGLTQFGCSGIAMQETPEFIVDTAVDVRRVQLEEKGYIRLNERRRFWTTELAALRGRECTPEVREEPENPHICYVNVGRHWVTAKGSALPLFETLDPISRFAESLRIRECDSVRIALREEAHRQFLRSELHRDPRIPKQISDTDPRPHIVGEPGAPNRGLFETVRELQLDSFPDEVSEVKKYVLDQKRE